MATKWFSFIQACEIKRINNRLKLRSDAGLEIIEASENRVVMDVPITDEMIPDVINARYYIC